MKKLMGGIVLLLLAAAALGVMACKPRKTEPKQPERKILYYRSPMNPAQTSPVPKKDEMGMDYVAVYAEEETGTGAGPAAVKVSAAVVQKIGVVTEEVKLRSLSRTVRATGALDFNETKVYTVTTKVMGWAQKLYVSYTGQKVRKGEPLFEFYSPDLVNAQLEYLQALKYPRTAGPGVPAEVANAQEELVSSAKRRLLYWDIPEGEIKALEKRGIPSKTLTMVSPDNGVVVEKMILEGQQIMPGMELYKIADLSTIWVIASIYQYELPWVKVGDAAEIELSYLPGQTFTGAVTFISPVLDMDTKTVSVRIEVKNTPDFELKPGMFATVKIKSAMTVNAVAAPEQAIIHSGERDFAVMSLGNGYFEPREVKLGVSADGYVEALSGISEGEIIVISSQFLIDSESNLRAAVQQLTAQPSK